MPADIPKGKAKPRRDDAVGIVFEACDAPGRILTLAAATEKTMPTAGRLSASSSDRSCALKIVSLVSSNRTPQARHCPTLTGWGSASEPDLDFEKQWVSK